MAKCGICGRRSGFWGMKLHDHAVCFKCLMKCQDFELKDKIIAQSREFYLKDVQKGIDGFTYEDILLEKMRNSNGIQDNCYTNNKQQIERLKHIVQCNHVMGLPVAENIFCTVDFQGNKLLINASGETFDLEYNKIVNLNIATEKELHVGFASSIGDTIKEEVTWGVFGEVAGTLGAIHGGRIQQKEYEEIKNYFIISYKKNNEIALISFKLLHEFNENYQKAQRLIAEHKPRILPQSSHTSL